MQKIIPLFLIMTILSSCGDPVINESSEEAQVGFLFSLIGMIIAIGITNLVKGFDTLLKYLPEKKEEFLPIGKTRWQMRLMWGISIALLIFQLIWGMRLALLESTSVLYFAYYIGLSTLVYAMVVYIFPENIESVFVKEKENQLEKFWSKSIITRLIKLYIIFLAYLFTTSYMSTVFYEDAKGTSTWQDGNILGLILKFTLVVIIGIAIFRKVKQKRQFREQPEKHSEKPNNSNQIITKLDIAIIVFSLAIHIYYIIIRTTYLW